MIYGHTSHGKRVSADVATRDDEYFCPGCGAKLILKQGEIRAKHFAHATGSFCSAFTENKMTEWHISHQMNFPEECREVRLEKDGVVHIADVKDGNLIVEFQHSPISNEAFEERSLFYSQFGHLVWVFDCIEKWENDSIKPCEDPKTKKRWFEWNHASQMLGKYDFKNSKFDLFIELDRSGWGCLVEWNPDGMKRFSGRLFNKKDVLEYFANIRDRRYGYSGTLPIPRTESELMFCENERRRIEREEQERKAKEMEQRRINIECARGKLAMLLPEAERLEIERKEAFNAYSALDDQLRRIRSEISAAEAMMA